jgi:outer membrane protein assembly factor BamD
MLGKVYHKFVIVSLLVISVSCSDFRKIQKSTDWKVKYDAAMKYYEKEDYYRSSTLFEEIMPYIRGSREAELVQFYNAYAHFHQKEYLLASHYFKNFYDTYNRSEFAEESYYMYAFSLFKQSPIYNLDQSSTEEALVALQNFLNRYPNSEYRKDIDDIMGKLMDKLERKAYQNAKQYYDLGYLNSAMIAFRNFRKDFPDSQWNEDVSFLMVLCSYQYAKKSIPSKQKERYYECVSHYEHFVDNYSYSKQIKDAEDYYDQSIKAIEQLTENNL